MIYNGPRPSNSVVMHQMYSNQHTYPNPIPHSLISTYNMHQCDDDRSFIGNRDNNGDILFDSKFECGNLDKVVKVNDWEYDLYIRVDTNTKGHY